VKRNWPAALNLIEERRWGPEWEWSFCCPPAGATCAHISDLVGFLGGGELRCQHRVQSESEKLAGAGKTKAGSRAFLLCNCSVAKRFPAKWPQNCVFCLIEFESNAETKAK